MTGDEYKALRLRLSLTQEQLGHKLGVTGNTVARRERGEQAIDSEAEAVIRRLVRESGK